MRYELHIDFLFPILNPWALVKSGSELNPRGFSENQCLHHNLASHQNQLLFAFLGRFFTENRSFSVLSRLSGHFGYSTTWIVADANIELRPMDLMHFQISLRTMDLISERGSRYATHILLRSLGFNSLERNRKNEIRQHLINP